MSQANFLLCLFLSEDAEVIRRGSGGGGCHLQEAWVLGPDSCDPTYSRPHPSIRVDGEALRADGVRSVGEKSHQK